MAKRKVKIIILFVLLAMVLIGVWHLYKRLEYSKQSSLIDVHDYVSPKAVSVININRRYNLDRLYIFDPSLTDLIKILNDNFTFPTLIAEYADHRKVLITRVEEEQEADINLFIEQISLSYQIKERRYKEATVLFASLPDGRYLIYTFYKGLLAVSYDYDLIQDFIDSDPENSFFSNQENIELITKIRNSTPVCFFIKLNKYSLILDYEAQSDSIKLSGYILNDMTNDSTDYTLIPQMIQLPDSICIDSVAVMKDNIPVAVRYFLNKKD